MKESEIIAGIAARLLAGEYAARVRNGVNLHDTRESDMKQSVWLAHELLHHARVEGKRRHEARLAAGLVPVND